VGGACEPANSRRSRGEARVPSVDAHTPSGRDGLGDLIGLEFLETTPEQVRARVRVTDDVRQPFGLVHGGVFASMAESMCSRGTWLGVRADEMAAMGQSNNATFMRPITEGHIHAAARPRHRGRTTWVWDVEITDDDGRLCGLVRVTVAVRPVPPVSRGTGS
jgi:1,4-dihydroxy-2-naphthoyl-CoA hydrolase